MKHITHNGITYEVEGEPMETCPRDTIVLLIYASGATVTSESPQFNRTTYYCNQQPIAWRPIVPPRVVEPVRRFEVENAQFTSSYQYIVVNTATTNRRWVAADIPTRSAAQAIADIYERAAEGGEG